MTPVNFAFSDTISGYVTQYLPDEKRFGLTTSDDRQFDVFLRPSTSAQLMRNLGEPYKDASGILPDMLKPGQMVMAYGTFVPTGDALRFEAQSLHFPGKSAESYRFEEPDWWIKQAASIADFYIKAQFGDNPAYDYRGYRTLINLTGDQSATTRQETDTISRMVYGLASAYLLTGEDRYLECADKGVEYMREHMRFDDTDENVVYWYHGIDVHGDKDHKIFTSEFGDDYDAIPMYEQIYALAGPMQVYRASGDPDIHRDLTKTMDLFDKFFEDKTHGGYFSHVDPILMSPHTDSLGVNKARKNWNSIGDHAPAYLINASLALGDARYGEFLVKCADMICQYFPDFDNSPFVQERFFEDWTPDNQWGWQQDRAVVGHNLKIAWNLMRINSFSPKAGYVELAEKIAAIMPDVGEDRQRFGWYDVVERTLKVGDQQHQFVWHDRKAWWQQEQGILAYQILDGCLPEAQYRKHGREGAAFYNAFFLDHDDGAVYFNVLSNGIPYLLGTERFKGSHSMSCYHSIELAYLSAVYTNLLRFRRPMNLFFKPHVANFPGSILRVAPDMLPQGSIRIGAVWIDGEPYTAFDADALTVTLPTLTHRPRVKVQIVPVSGESASTSVPSTVSV